MGYCVGDVAQETQFFNQENDFEHYLKRFGVVSLRDIRFSKEAALFSSIKRFLFKHNDLFFLTDEAGQFRLPFVKHSLCWLHVARKLKKLLPYTPEQSELKNGSLH